MDNDLNKEEEKLELQGQLLGITEQWWSEVISLKISEHNFLKSRLMEKWNEQDFSRMSQLEKDIEHLQRKCTWEQKEMSKYQEKCKNFQRNREKKRLVKFTKNLNKIFEKDPPK